MKGFKGLKSQNRLWGYKFITKAQQIGIQILGLKRSQKIKQGFTKELIGITSSWLIYAQNSFLRLRETQK